MQSTHATMNALLVAARAIHFGSAMLLFGELVFVLAVATPAWRNAGRATFDHDKGIVHRLVLVEGWSLAVSIASGAIWLAIEASSMSGMPLEQAINRNTLSLVLSKTVFGRLWVWRFGLAVAVGALLVALGRTASGRSRSRLALGCVVVAAVYLVSLAWAGHAAAGQDSQGLLQLSSDIVHLLAAGGWLGALPGLVFLLGHSPSLDAAAQAARRFSTLGVVCVGALVLSGLANAWYLVGSAPALVGTEYGWLLLAKLAVFASMVTLAAVNRLSLTPRLERQDSRALRFLRRNATGEIAAGIIVVAIVGTLGTTIPGAHQSPIWPFDHTLSWEDAQQATGAGAALAVTGIIACLAAGFVLVGVRRHRPRVWIAGITAIIVAAMAWTWLLAVPAYPTTYAASPVRHTTDSIVRGAALYAQRCSTCHGIDGHGDGPAAPSLSVKPVDLVEHEPHHRAGDLFWWIAHGIPGTPMPGFASQMSDAEIWDLIQFLRAQSEAEDALALINRVEPWRPIVAPDFTFEGALRMQESLQQHRGRYIVLVVFYTLPQSLSRLQALAAARSALEQAGARVIAVPTSASSTAAASDTLNLDQSMFVMTSPDVAAAYAMFARRKDAAPGDAAPAHMEFLIDRQGYLRARWIGVPDAATDRTTWMLAQIEVLKHEPPHAPSSQGHAHAR
jgi:putative copper export protein/mono/diheme cytochrome c family protein/peroxiredoxin